MLKKNNFLLCLIIFYITSCDGIFQRFSYEKFECLKNNFGVKKIWITKKQNISKARILIEDHELDLNSVDETDSKIVFEIRNGNIKFEISKKTNLIHLVYNNSLVGLNCKRNSFKM